jgi:retinol dehydrogenase 12
VCTSTRIMFISLIIINIVLYILIVLYVKLTCGINKCSKHLVGKVVIVTGGNAGIGYETAKDLAERGAKVILGCRSVERGTAARDKIINSSGNKDVHFKLLDLSSLKSVREFANDILRSEKELHILINNAGIIGQEYTITEDGLLLDMQTNHFGHFLLTSLLLPLLKSSGPSRIINVSSKIHERGRVDLDNINGTKESYGAFQSYSNSKLCNVLMTVELANRLKGTEVTVNCLHPGTVMTNIFRVRDRWWTSISKPIIELLCKTPWTAAQTSNYLAVSPDVNNVSGKYFADCHLASSSALRDVELAKKLWDLSERLTNIK